MTKLIATMDRLTIPTFAPRRRIARRPSGWLLLMLFSLVLSRETSLPAQTPAGSGTESFSVGGMPAGRGNRPTRQRSAEANSVGRQRASLREGGQGPMAPGVTVGAPRSKSTMRGAAPEAQIHVSGGSDGGRERAPEPPIEPVRRGAPVVASVAKVPAASQAQEMSLVREVAGGDWIISSRDVKGSPATHDCAGQMQYLYRTPEGMSEVSAEEFLSTLRSDRPVCVVIHGSYNYWKDVLAESTRNHRWIQQAARGSEVQVVHFSWPSDGVAHVLFPVELRVMGRRAAVHGGYLAQLISMFPADQPVTLVGHSHGARCVVAALHAMGGGALDDGSHLGRGARPPRRVRGVLIAAAIDHDWLNPGERYDRALTPVEGMLVLTNPRDGWLQVYPLHTPMKGTQALGLEGLTRRDQRQLGGWADRVQNYDCSEWVGRSHDFATFNGNPGLADVIRNYVVY